MTGSKPSERVYYRHKRSGVVGYLVEKDGVTKVKRDIADPYALHPYNPDDWEQMTEPTRVPRMQIAFIQWAADRALLRALGELKAANRDWHSLTDEERIKFTDEGPGKNHGEVRKRLWEAVKQATESLVG